LDLFVTNHGLERILSNPASEDEYVRGVVELLRDPGARAALGSRLGSHMRRHHTGDGWLSALEGVYAFVERQSHVPRRLHTTVLETTDLDLAVSGWQVLNGGRELTPSLATRLARQTLLNAVKLARGRRDYAGAREILRHYRRTFGVDRQMLTAAVQLPLHQLYKGWRPAAPGEPTEVIG
jgi:hypothetical protein